MPTELSDLAIVVRGGLMTDLLLLQRRVQRDFRQVGLHVLSVWAKDRETGQTVDDVVDELAQRGRVRNTQLRTTTAGVLRSRGFVLAQTGAEPSHYRVDLGSAELAAIARFVKSFGPARRNPR